MFQKSITLSAVAFVSASLHVLNANARVESIYWEGDSLPGVTGETRMANPNGNQFPIAPHRITQNNQNEAVFRFRVLDSSNQEHLGIWKSLANRSIQAVTLGDEGPLSVSGFDPAVKLTTSPVYATCGSYFDPNLQDQTETPTILDNGSVVFNSYVRGPGISHHHCLGFENPTYQNDLPKMGTDRVSILQNSNGQNHILFQSGLDFATRLPTFDANGDLYGVSTGVRSNLSFGPFSVNVIETGWWMFNSLIALKSVTNRREFSLQSMRFETPLYFDQVYPNNSPLPGGPPNTTLMRSSFVSHQTGNYEHHSLLKVASSPHGRFEIWTALFKYGANSNYEAAYVVESGTLNARLIRYQIKNFSPYSPNDPEALRTFDPNAVSAPVPAIDRFNGENIQVNDNGDVAFLATRAVSVQQNIYRQNIRIVQSHYIKGTRLPNGSYVFRTLATSGESIPEMHAIVGSVEETNSLTSNKVQGLGGFKLLNQGDVLSVLMQVPNPSTGMYPNYQNIRGAVVLHSDGQPAQAILNSDQTTYSAIGHQERVTLDHRYGVDGTTSFGSTSAKMILSTLKENTNGNWYFGFRTSPEDQRLSLVVSLNGQVKILKAGASPISDPSIQFSTSDSPVTTTIGAMDDRNQIFLGNPSFASSQKILYIDVNGELQSFDTRSLTAEGQPIQLVTDGFQFNRRGSFLATAWKNLVNGTTVGPNSVRGLVRITLGVESSQCAVDLDESGAVSPDDIFVFLDSFHLGHSRADWNRDGQVSLQDLFAFLNSYFIGC